MHVKLKDNVAGKAKGITAHGIPYKSFHKGVIMEISEEEAKTLEENNMMDKFDIIESEDYDKLTADSNAEAEKLLKSKTPEDADRPKQNKLGEVSDFSDRTKDNKSEESLTTGDDKVYTEKEAYDLNKEEQTLVLKKREIKSTDIGKLEEDRVKQILESNPA